jgi:hypothetical protein
VVIASPENMGSGAPTTNNPGPPDDDAPGRGSKPPEEVGTENQPHLTKLVERNIVQHSIVAGMITKPPLISNRHVVGSEIDTTVDNMGIEGTRRHIEG